MQTVTRSTFVIAVPNLESSAAFYRDVLGFTIESLGAPGWLFFVSGDCRIMAGECPDAIPPSKLGDHSYFAYLHVEKIDSYYAFVRKAGGKMCKTLRNEPWGQREFGVFTADGHRIMFGSPVPNATNVA
jgi:predicted enzyme related to lactoylglutathione lyase